MQLERSILSTRIAVSYTWYQVPGTWYVVEISLQGSTLEFLGSSRDAFQLPLAVPSVTAHVGSQSSSRVYCWQPYTWCLILDAFFATGPLKPLGVVVFPHS